MLDFFGFYFGIIIIIISKNNAIINVGEKVENFGDIVA